MGYSISWLAIQGKNRDAILDQIGLFGTRQFGEFDDLKTGNTNMTGCTLPSGWYLLVAMRCEHKIISDPIALAMSSTCTAIGCSIEEHVMYSSASCWIDSALAWRIKHDSEKDERDLDALGNLPAEFDVVRGTYAAKQDAEVDGPMRVDYFFEIPLELAFRRVGFKHDTPTPGVTDGSFEILRLRDDGLLAKSIKPWWKVW